MTHIGKGPDWKLTWKEHILSQSNWPELNPIGTKKKKKVGRAVALLKWATKDEPSHFISLLMVLVHLTSESQGSKGWFGEQTSLTWLDQRKENSSQKLKDVHHPNNLIKFGSPGIARDLDGPWKREHNTAWELQKQNKSRLCLLRTSLVFPVVKNPSCNPGMQVQFLIGQLRSYMLWDNWASVQRLLGLHAITREFVCCNERSHMLQLRPYTVK